MAKEAYRARLRVLLARAGRKGGDLDLYEAAFVHETAVREGLAARSNQRLEFLGDAVLGAIVARSLYDRYPDAPEGELTLRKSSLVSDAALAETADRLGFGALLVLGAGLANEPPERRRNRLADAFEAFVAVLAADAGDAVAASFVAREHVAERERDAPAELDPKTVLQEWTQRRFGAVPAYEDRHEGPDHARTFFASVEVAGEVRAEGSGPSKKLARRAAAAAALEALAARYDDVTAKPLPAARPATRVRKKRTARAVPSKRARA